MIESTFWPIDRSRILVISTGAQEVYDKLVWHYAKDGRFFVSSCYDLIFSRQMAMDVLAEGSSSSSMEILWDEIWRLKRAPNRYSSPFNLPPLDQKGTMWYIFLKLREHLA